MTEKIKGYLVKIRKDLPRGDPEAYAMYFCRGEGKCLRSRFKREHSKKHCENCLLGDERITVGELAERLKRGDA